MNDLGIGHNTLLAYLGYRLGLWRGLAAHPGSTSAELAQRLGYTERYVREWLAAQAAAGYVTYDPATQSFTLPAEHALVLADEDGPAFMASGFEVLASVWPTVDELAHGYASGEGIGWHEHDSRLFVGFERFFGPAFRNLLVAEWLPAVPELVERLESGIRVLDVGCGLGTATIAMAEAFPASTFVGIDYHEESVRRAGIAANGMRGGRPGHLRGRRGPGLRGRPTTSSACSTPCTTWVTRSVRWRTPGRTSPRTGGSSPWSPTRATGWRTTSTRSG